MYYLTPLYTLESLFSLRTVAPDAVTLKNRFSQYCENISDDLLIEHTSLRLLDVLGQGTYGIYNTTDVLCVCSTGYLPQVNLE